MLADQVKSMDRYAGGLQITGSELAHRADVEGLFEKITGRSLRLGTAAAT